MPSAKCRTFNFRWRGNETGEGEIQGDADEDLCSITFENPNALSGIFVSGLTGEQEFQGFREGFDAETATAKRKCLYAKDPREAWADLGPFHHERLWARWFPDEPYPEDPYDIEENSSSDFSDESLPGTPDDLAEDDLEESSDGSFPETPDDLTEDDLEEFSDDEVRDELLSEEEFARGARLMDRLLPLFSGDLAAATRYFVRTREEMTLRHLVDGDSDSDEDEEE